MEISKFDKAINPQLQKLNKAQKKNPKEDYSKIDHKQIA